MLLAMIAGMFVSLLPIDAVASGTGVERPATRSEIEKVAVGHTLLGSMTYAPNGRYAYGTASSGTYRILDGEVCVAFDNGSDRCDRIVTVNGSDFALVNARGERFPYR